MTHRAPFQPLTFCDSVIVWTSVVSSLFLSSCNLCLVVAGSSSSRTTHLLKLLLAGACHPEKNREFAKMVRLCGQLLLVEQPRPPSHATGMLCGLCGYYVGSVILGETPWRRWKLIHSIWMRFIFAKVLITNKVKSFHSPWYSKQKRCLSPMTHHRSQLQQKGVC